MTSRIKQPSLYRWPSGECISIGGLSIRLNEIAERHELTVEPALFTPVDVRWPMCCRLGNFGSAKPVGPLAFLFVRPS